MCTNMEYSLILGVLASNMILCRSNFMIMTRHQGVNDHYLEMIQLEEQQVQKDFKRWDSNTKLTTCRKVIDVVSFIVLDETTEDLTFGLVPYSTNNFMSRLHLLYNLGDMDAINYTMVAVKVNDVLREVPTHLCIVDSSYQVSIAQGTYNDVYFFLDKTEEMNLFRLGGIAEPKAFVHPLINYSLKQLKIAYADSLIEQMEHSKPIRSLCPLSEYRKYRVCSLAYVAFMEQNGLKIDNKITYIRVKDDRICIKQAKLLMEVQNEFYYILTDLISCTIDTVLSTFKFYLAADPCTKDSAYILRRVRRSPSNNLTPLGNFTFASRYESDSSNRVKDFRKKLQKSDTTALKPERTENSTRKSDATSVDSFYTLDMIVMKLTPLIELDDLNFPTVT